MFTLYFSFISWMTFCSVISFGDHLHFELGYFDGVAFSDHSSKCTVPTEAGICGYQKITEIY